MRARPAWRHSEARDAWRMMVPARQGSRRTGQGRGWLWRLPPTRGPRRQIGRVAMQIRDPSARSTDGVPPHGEGQQGASTGCGGRGGAPACRGRGRPGGDWATAYQRRPTSAASTAALRGPRCAANAGARRHGQGRRRGWPWRLAVDPRAYTSRRPPWPETRSESQRPAPDMPRRNANPGHGPLGRRDTSARRVPSGHFEPFPAPGKLLPVFQIYFLFQPRPQKRCTAPPVVSGTGNRGLQVHPWPFSSHFRHFGDQNVRRNCFRCPRGPQIPTDCTQFPIRRSTWATWVQ